MKTAEVTTANVFEHPLNENAEMQEAFKDFLKMRVKMRKPATERAIKLLLVTLIKLSDGKPDVAIAIIDQSIVSSYLDFYQLREQRQDFNFGNDQSKKRTEL